MKVELLNSMGDDLTVVNAARVSMAKHSDELTDDDRKLIRYLAKHQHWTPFSQVTVQIRYKMPIFVARQWFKHQVGFTRNETSRRYVDTLPEFWHPVQWRSRAASVKQGSGGPIEGPRLHEIGYYYGKATKVAAEMYEALLSCGVAPEQARAVLPQAMMTEFVETGSLAGYARIYKLRTDEHAQSEVRVYAREVGEVMKQIAPVSWIALTEEL